MAAHKGVRGLGKIAKCPKLSRESAKLAVKFLKPLSVAPTANFITVRGRVEQLEGSYSEILALLKQKPQTEATAVSTSTPSHADTYRASQSTGLTSPLCSSSTQPDATSNFLPGLPLEECEILVNDYRRMSSNHFPYVIIPEACPVATLIDERPMLAQAVFIVTAWRLPHRQHALRDKFLQDFSDRYFIKSERSLDLLQALIVYFGWYHLLFRNLVIRAD